MSDGMALIVFSLTLCIMQTNMLKTSSYFPFRRKYLGLGLREWLGSLGMCSLTIISVWTHNIRYNSPKINGLYCSNGKPSTSVVVEWSLYKRQLWTCISSSNSKALWRSGYRDRLEICFLREHKFESCQRRVSFASWTRRPEISFLALRWSGSWTGPCVGGASGARIIFLLNLKLVLLKVKAMPLNSHFII